jgi:hypothetical protein
MTDTPAAPAPAGKQPPAAAAPDAARERVGKLRAQLAEAEAALPAEPGTVRLRVTEPHDSFTVGGVSVGTDPTPVPAHAVPQLMTAAGEAGVTLEEATGA